MTRAILFLLALTPCAASAATLQERLLAGASATPAESVAFTRTTRVEQRQGSSAPEVHIRIERYDPARPAAQRWSLLNIDGRPPTSDEMVGAAETYAGAPVPSYFRLSRWLGAKATCDAKACRYPALPKGIFIVNGHDISLDTTAEAVIGGTAAAPFVERTHFVSTKGFRMMLVAKVDRVEASQAYRLLSPALPVPAEFETLMTGSMMGKTGTIRTTTTFSDWRAAGSPTR